MRNARKTPIAISTMLQANGNCQLPKRSIKKPESTGADSTHARGKK
jgi:hypothetical protein